MKTFIITLSLFGLMVLLSDCTKDETNGSPSKGININCYIDHVPLLNDTAFASFKITLTHLPLHAVDSIISMDIAVHMVEEDILKDRIFKDIYDTIPISKLNETVISGMDIVAPDTGLYEIRCNAELIIEWVDSQSTSHTNFSFPIENYRIFWFHAFHSYSELIDSTVVDF